jgi:lipopolysaccharide transport system ATP-binding protein
MTAGLKVRDLTKVFALAEHGGAAASLTEILRSGDRARNVREVRALDGVGFEIRHGERVGIIGANGAGKTTLLSILAGLTTATSGTVEVSGDIHAMLSIGAVLREDMTGRENIRLDFSIHGKKNDVDSLTERVIAFSELEKFIDRPVRTYSSGMKARLAFSMGAFLDPEILILDETLAVGDVFFAAKASRRMREVAQSGSIVILVSHAMGSIREMCDRCLWLEDGRLKADGDPVAVTRQYERAVQQSDEEDLRRKFSNNPALRARKDVAELDKLFLLQEAVARPATLAAMQPVTFDISGRIKDAAGSCDIVLRLWRVDGRKLWQDSLSAHGGALPRNGAFRVSVAMDPMVLGADLYRLDVELRDETGVCDVLGRAFEVIDEEGQVGGKPLLYYPSTIFVRAETGAGQ